LPGFGADPNSITISGFSGGGFMADQMKVIFSDTFKGAGLLAGGPYYNMFFYGLHDELGTSEVMAQ
jgi:poly(3-hydroxybutyrate) depolymerase